MDVIHEDPDLTEIQERLDALRAERARYTDTPAGLQLDLARLRAAVASPEHQERLARDAARERDAARRTLRALARERDIPEDDDLRAVALDENPTETAALGTFRQALAWRGGRRRGCIHVVGGPRGVGKSAALAWVLLRSEAGALYVQAPDVAGTPRNGFSENAHRWDRWLSVPVLGVDDLGAETGDPDTVSGLLWQRYDRGLASLVTTNLSREGLVARYFRGEIGVRLADRLVNAQGGAGLAWFVGLTGASLRNAEVRAALLGGGGDR